MKYCDLSEEEALSLAGSPPCEKCAHRLAFHLLCAGGLQYCMICGTTIGECYQDGPLVVL